MKTPPMTAFRRSCHKKIKSPGVDSFAINNFVNYSMRSMLGSEEKFSWDTVAQNDSVNDMINKYVTELFMSEDQKKEHAEDEQRRKEEQKRNMENFKFSNFFEDTIGGFFSRLGDDMNELASDVGNSAAGVKGAAVSVWNGVTGAVSSAVGAVGTFAEKTGNLFSEGHFVTNETASDLGMTEADYTEWKQYQKEQEALGIDVQYSKTKIKIDESEQKGSTALHNIENFEEEYVKNGKINDKTFFKDFKNIEEFNKYLDAKLDIKRMDDSLIDITNDDATNLSKTLRQSENGALSLQLQKEYEISPAEANKAASTSCKSATSYWMLKLNGAEVGSYSEFLKENIEDGKIKNENGYVNAGLIEKYGFESKTIDNYDEFTDSVIGKFGETRIRVNATATKDAFTHSVATYSDNDSRKIADIGKRGYGGAVLENVYAQGSKNGKKEYFKYFHYIEKKRGRK